MSERVREEERDDCGYTIADIVKNHGDPVWEAIWGVVKEWDISRKKNGLFSGGTGTEVQCIFDAVTAALAARPASAEPVGDVLPSEALFGFMGWLTSREHVSGPFSASHNASSAADLVSAFCKSQGWEMPRDAFPRMLADYPVEPFTTPPAAAQDREDAERYRFLRDNPLQLRAIDGNASWHDKPSDYFDAHTDIALNAARAAGATDGK